MVKRKKIVYSASFLRASNPGTNGQVKIRLPASLGGASRIVLRRLFIGAYINDDSLKFGYPGPSNNLYMGLHFNATLAGIDSSGNPVNPFSKPIIESMSGGYSQSNSSFVILPFNTLLELDHETGCDLLIQIDDANVTADVVGYLFSIYADVEYLYS